MQDDWQPCQSNQQLEVAPGETWQCCGPTSPDSGGHEQNLDVVAKPPEGMEMDPDADWTVQVVDQLSSQTYNLCEVEGEMGPDMPPVGPPVFPPKPGPGPEPEPPKPGPGGGGGDQPFPPDFPPKPDPGGGGGGPDIPKPFPPLGRRLAFMPWEVSCQSDKSIPYKELGSDPAMRDPFFLSPDSCVSRSPDRQGSCSNTLLTPFPGPGRTHPQRFCVAVTNKGKKAVQLGLTIAQGSCVPNAQCGNNQFCGVGIGGALQQYKIIGGRQVPILMVPPPMDPKQMQGETDASMWAANAAGACMDCRDLCNSVDTHFVATSPMMAYLQDEALANAKISCGCTVACVPKDVKTCEKNSNPFDKSMVYKYGNPVAEYGCCGASGLFCQSGSDCPEPEKSDTGRCARDADCTSGKCEGGMCCHTPGGVSSRCSVCGRDGECLNCKGFLYRLEDGQCVTRLPDPPSIPSFCVSDLMCKSYKGQKKCAKQCCKSTEGMDDACVECNRGGGCSKCDSGYELVRGACKSKASEFCSNDGQCDSKKCKRKCCKDKSGGMDDACEICGSDGECLNCMYGYFLDKGSKTCKAIPTEEDKCDKCGLSPLGFPMHCKEGIPKEEQTCCGHQALQDVACLACGDDGECGSCKPGFELSREGAPGSGGGSLRPGGPPVGPPTGEAMCLPVRPPTPTFCDEDKYCPKPKGAQPTCKEQCCLTPNGLDENCEECNTDGACGSCKEGFRLDKDGKCTQVEEEKKCQGDNDCGDGKCKQECCKAGGPGMEDACNVCNTNGGCGGCAEGFELDKYGICFPIVPESCAKGANCPSGLCKEQCCMEGGPGMDDSCAVCNSEGLCGKCAKGFIVNKLGGCDQERLDGRCLDDSQCPSGVCRKHCCEKGVDPMCLACNIEGGCGECAEGFKLDADGSCKEAVKPPPPPPPTECRDDTMCKSGSCKGQCCETAYAKAAECTACNGLGECAGCQDGFELTKKGECISLKPETCQADNDCKYAAGPQAIADPKCKGQCCVTPEAMDENCVECNKDGGCGGCAEGYRLDKDAKCAQVEEEKKCQGDGDCGDGKCKQECCTAGGPGMDDACTVCNTDGGCGGCAAGYELDSSKTCAVAKKPDPEPQPIEPDDDTVAVCGRCSFKQVSGRLVREGLCEYDNNCKFLMFSAEMSKAVQEVPAAAFEGLSSLEFLEFKGMPGLFKIDLDVDLPALKTIVLEDIPVQNLKLGKGLGKAGGLSLTLANCPGLAKFWVNEVSNTPGYFGDNVESLMMSNVPLSDKLGAEFFSSLGSLESLSITGSDVVKLGEGALDAAPKLTRFALSNSNLETLPRGVFAGAAALEHVDLSANKLVVLPPNLAVGLGNLESFNLKGNPLECVPVMPPQMEQLEGRVCLDLPDEDPDSKKSGGNDAKKKIIDRIPGGIVGGSVAAAGIVLLLGTIAYCWRRRSYRSYRFQASALSFKMGAGAQSNPLAANANGHSAPYSQF